MSKKMPTVEELMTTMTEVQVVRNLRANGSLITLEDILAWQKLLAEIFSVRPEDIQPPVQSKDLEYLNKMLDELGEGQQSKRKYSDVIKMYFGIGTYKHSIKEIAEHFEKTAPAIRVDIIKTMRRLRQPNRARDYKRFMMPIELEEQVLNLTSVIEDKQIEIGVMAREIKRLQEEAADGKTEKAASESAAEPKDLLFRSLRGLEWSVRTWNSLTSIGLENGNIADLTAKSEKNLRNAGFSTKSIREIVNMLAKYGLELRRITTA